MRVDSGWEAAVGLVVGSVAAVLGRLVACRVESLFLLACCISMGVTPNTLGVPVIGSRCRLRRGQRLSIVRISRKELCKFMFLASTDVCSLGCD